MTSAQNLTKSIRATNQLDPRLITVQSGPWNKDAKRPLKVGDRVWWNDPDEDNCCSGWGVIQDINTYPNEPIDPNCIVNLKMVETEDWVEALYHELSRTENKKWILLPTDREEGWIREGQAGPWSAKPKDKYVADLQCLNSRPDFAGNRYWGFCWTDRRTGKAVAATISGNDSNIRGIITAMGLDSDRVFYSRCEDMPIRVYNLWVKDLPYAGCRPEDIANFIKTQLQNGRTAQTGPWNKKPDFKVVGSKPIFVCHGRFFLGQGYASYALCGNDCWYSVNMDGGIVGDVRWEIDNPSEVSILDKILGERMNRPRRGQTGPWNHRDIGADHGLGVCECGDPGCPANHRQKRCPNWATGKYRQPNDDKGRYICFCQECGDDACSSGNFSSYDDDE